MEHALLYTGKSQINKFTKNIDSPLEKQAFDMAMKMFDHAKETALSHADSTFEKTVIAQKKPQNAKQNSAVDLFSITKGSHNLHLEHELEKKGREEEKVAKQAERKKEQEGRKRKRIESEDIKESRKRERRLQSKEALKRFQERTCQAQPCKHAFDEVLSRAKFWHSCPCGRFYICPPHKAGDLGSTLISKHQQECINTPSNP